MDFPRLTTRAMPLALFELDKQIRDRQTVGREADTTCLSEAYCNMPLL